MSRELYFDNAGSTPLLPEALERFGELAQIAYANSSSGHAVGKRAKGELEALRRTLGMCVGVPPEGVVFTAGATESNNTVLRRFAQSRVLLSATEHPSVYETALVLRERGVKVELLPVSREGSVDPAVLREHLKQPADLVSIMTVNNETGVRNPIELLAQVVRDHGGGALFHTDTAQSVSPAMWPQELEGIDFLTLSAHKFHGPKGVGALLMPKPRKFAPLLTGGGQEGGLRSGTSPVPLIGAMVCALERTLEGRGAAFTQRCDLFWETLLARTPGLSFTTTAPGAPWIKNFAFLGLRGDAFARALEGEGLHVSTGSACAGQKGGLSRVLKAMGCDPQRGHIRMSLSHLLSLNDLERALKIVPETYERYALV